MVSELKKIKGAVSRVFCSCFVKTLPKLSLNAVTHKMLLELREGDIKRIFARNANHNTFFDNFCEIQAQNLKTFKVVIHFHPWSKTLINSFTEFV